MTAVIAARQRRATATSVRMQRFVRYLAPGVVLINGSATVTKGWRPSITFGVTTGVTTGVTR